MVFKIAGGIGLILLGAATFMAIPKELTGVLLIIGGIGLLAGI
jgi:hypothetical protein